ncbi:MAG: hypothetical protein HPY52_16900 [Firmicutes bacterium]|nr:hypothetical protein [Bacillota bacterium]
MVRCKACKEPIEWVKLSSGKLMPVNCQYVTVVTDGGEVVRGRTPHWATCPFAESFRKTGEDESEKAPA